MTVIEKKVAETVTRYVAKDGTEFNREEDCLRYEQTMGCVFKTRLRGIMTHISKEGMWEKGLDCLFDDGCARSEYYKITPETEEDINNLVGYLQSTNASEGHEKYNTVRLNFNELKVDETYLFVYIADCEYSFITSLDRLTETIKSGWNFLMEDEKNEEEKGE